MYAFASGHPRVFCFVVIFVMLSVCPVVTPSNGVAAMVVFSEALAARAASGRQSI